MSCQAGGSSRTRRTSRAVTRKGRHCRIAPGYCHPQRLLFSQHQRAALALRFSRCGRRNGFIWAHKSPRQHPLTLVRGIFPLHQQNVQPALDQTKSRDVNGHGAGWDRRNIRRLHGFNLPQTDLIRKVKMTLSRHLDAGQQRIKAQRKG